MHAEGGNFVAENDELLAALQRECGAREITRETLRRFHEVPPDWRCPACCRLKKEIARLDKNGNLLCRIVSHHDHFTDVARDGLEFEAWPVVQIAFKRFSPTLICQDCNVADVAAKRTVNAPEDFSFAPFEIAYFIKVKRNKGHDFDRDRAQTAYDAARLSVWLLRQMLDEAKAQPADEPEHISGPINRLLAAIRAKMSNGGEQPP